MNYCSFIGNLGQDPEIKQLDSGTTLARFSIGCSEKWKNKDGTPQEHTEWVRCVSFGKLSEIIGQYVNKGDKVFVSGKMNTRKWEDNEGNTRYSTEIKVDNLEMLGGGNKSGGKPKQQGNPRQADAFQSPSKQKDFDDDIPF